MPYFHVFLWDGHNEQHLAVHGVTPDEFEFAVLYANRVEASRSSERLVAFDTTPSGRDLVCVFEIIDEIYCYPITAYEAP